MGIPRFYSWLGDRQWSGVITRERPLDAYSLFIDLNTIIHTEAAKVYGYGLVETLTEDDANRLMLGIRANGKERLEAMLFVAITDRIMRLTHMVLPSQLLVIAIDGVAPQAKVHQQRQRRYRSAKLGAGNDLFDPTCITPGTDFMFRLDAEIKRWITNNTDKLPPRVVFSGHMIPGEGEHKILDYMRGGLCDIPGDYVLNDDDEEDHEEDSHHYIYGLDADLVALSLVAPVHNIVLIREDINVVRIEPMKDALANEISIDIPTRAAREFVLMMPICGNDFLPPLPGMKKVNSSMNIVLDVLKQHYISNPTTALLKLNEQGDEIDLQCMMDMFNAVAKREQEIIDSYVGQTYVFPSSIIEASKVEVRSHLGEFRVKADLQRFRFYWYLDELAPKLTTTNSSPFIEEFLGIVPVDPDDSTKGSTLIERSDKLIEDMCMKYIACFIWNYYYYTKGRSAVSKAMYYPYSRAPLASDIVRYCSEITFDSLNEYLNSFSVSIMHKEGQPQLSPIHQLLQVIPPLSINVLPEPLRPLLTEPLSSIADLVPIDYMMDTQGINFKDEARPVIPSIDYHRIYYAVLAYPLPKEFTDRYKRDRVGISVRARINKTKYMDDLMCKRDEVYPRKALERMRGTTVKKTAPTTRTTVLVDPGKRLGALNSPHNVYQGVLRNIVGVPNATPAAPRSAKVTVGSTKPVREKQETKPKMSIMANIPDIFIVGNK